MLRPAHLLRSDKIAAHITENPVTLAILLCIAWILPGLVGHDPWKPDEAHTFGVVYQLLKNGDWVVPMLAGEPYLNRPPLFYLTAALTGTLFSPVLPLHDAARLATGVYMALTFLFIALTAKELYGSAKSWVAALMLLGCGGLLLRGHQLIADAALLAGLAIGLYALAISARRPLIAGLWLGTGLGVCILSDGLVEPFMLLLTMVLLPIVSSHWRTRYYLLTVAVALVVATPWAVVWPMLLEARSPQLFAEWFWVQNVERLKSIFVFTPDEDYFYYVNVLPWFAWPAWPFALWGLWVEGRAGLQKPGIMLPLVALVTFFLFLSIIGEGRDVYGMPLLLPISLLAVVSFETLKRGAANLYYWFAIILFTFFAVVGHRRRRADEAVEAHDGHAAGLPVGRTCLCGDIGRGIHACLARAAVQRQAPAGTTRHYLGDGHDHAVGTGCAAASQIYRYREDLSRRVYTAGAGGTGVARLHLQPGAGRAAAGDAALLWRYPDRTP